MSDDEIIVLVSNIPASYHTADLRRFFSDWVEKEKFTCFHFRHRIEKRQSDSENESNSNQPSSSTSDSNVHSSFSQQVTARVHKSREDDKELSADKSSRQNETTTTCCCLVKIHSESLDEFISSFHRKHWLDSEDCEMIVRCLLAKITSDEQRNLKSMPELRPPNIMPRGNVGTPTKFFLDAIRDCRLPAKLIGKLKLEFPKGRHKKYGSVPFDYEERRGKIITNLTSINRKKLQDLNSKGPQVEDAKDNSDPEDDDDTCEEWERHEALHDDVQANRTIGRQVNSNSYLAEGGDLEQQAGTKQKAFEDEIELVWEKGGSGLNFYTDVQFWKSQESGDFDEETTDDWDVDMSVYYEKDTNHDKDAVDRLNMRTSEFLRSGKHEESVFEKKRDKQRQPQSFKRPSGAGFQHKANKKSKEIGLFEVHNRGVAGEIMAKSGWKEGKGLGSKGQGIPQALDGEEDGQRPRDKRGLGYHGEKIVFAPNINKTGKLVQSSDTASPSTSGGYQKSTWRPAPPPGARITTAFTRPEDLDPPERVDRTNPQLYMKFRDQSIKFHSGGVQGGSKD